MGIRSTGFLSRRSVLLATTVALLVGVLPAGTAVAQEVSITATERVLDKIEHQRIQVRLADGAIARGNVVSYPEGEPTIGLRPKLARGTISGLRRFTSMAADEVGSGAVVGTNGGYWLPRPSGAPNGLYVERGRLLAGDASNMRGDHAPRGMLGVQTDGSLVMDRLLTTLTLDLPDHPLTEAAAFNEINRQVRSETDPARAIDGELLLYDDRYGTEVHVPAGSLVATVQDLEIRPSGRTQGTIFAAEFVADPTPVAVPPGLHLLVAYGDRLEVLLGVAPGDQVGVTTTITPYNSASTAWEAVESGLAGGQVLVQNGERRSLTEWRTMAFSETHVTGRQPRTAIARTGDGRILMVTIDGRQNGWSVGMTLRDLAATLISLGAVDALNLDGGGSTTMTIGGTVRNRPSEFGRSVANGLFLYVERPAPARNLQLACPAGLVPLGGFADVPGTTHASSIDCLSWWKVTSGVTPTTFAPSANVTRAQMATFLAKWIDDLAARGEGQALPSDADLRFADVSETNTHARSIARLDEAGILTGRSATTFEPGVPVSRAQTASLVRQSVEYVARDALPANRDTFIDDNGSVHEGGIDALAGVGVIGGTGGFNYAPAVPVSRGAMASLLMRAADLAVERQLTTIPS